MEGSGLSTLDNDDERRALVGLLDAFGSVFSLEEIAFAYCEAGCDADLAAAMLFNLTDSTSSSSMPSPNSIPNSEESPESFHSNIYEKPFDVEWTSKSSKPRNHPVAGGTVSCVLGKGYLRPKGYPRPKSVANESCTGTKPLKLDSNDIPVSQLFSEESSLNSAKDTEDFLFKMLGDGFQLDRDMIQEVLGCCGYDVQKSMETLLDLSTVTSEKGNNLFGGSHKMSTDTCPKLESLSCVRGDMNLDLKASGTELPREQKGHNDLQQEVLSALFHVAQSSEEFPARTVAVNAVKRSRASRQVVVEPLGNTTVEDNVGNINLEHGIEEDDEKDGYLVLRKAVKEYQVAKKEYYKAAVEAFAKGDLALAHKLWQEGQFFHRKAREANDESAAIIFEARNEETEDAVSLDLHNQDTKEAIRLLKCHISSCSSIPSIKYLNVIVEMNDEDTSKRARNKRLMIIKLLEKESITWTGGANPGTMLIRLDGINPKRLSFARK